MENNKIILGFFWHYQQEFFHLYIHQNYVVFDNEVYHILKWFNDFELELFIKLFELEKLEQVDQHFQLFWFLQLMFVGYG